MPCKKCKDGKVKWGERGECKYDTIEECENANAEYSEQSKTTRIVELIIEEDNQELAIDAISLVSAPAIEQDFVFFGKDKHNLTFAKVDEEKRMLVSPALIPSKSIFRYDPNTDSEYYVYFSKDTIRKAAELYLKHNNHHKATYEHSDRVAGVLTTESWIKEGNQDKSKLYGYDLPNGTWFVKMKIENEELWSKIKEGELKGLSIEGYFIDKMQKMSEKQPTDKEILSALNEIIRESRSGKVEFKDAKTLSKQINESKTLIKQVGGLIKSMNAEGKVSNSFEKQFNALEKEREAIRKQEDKIGNNWDKAYQKYDKTNDKVGAARDKLWNLQQSLDKNIATLEASLKQLGIDSPPIIGKAKSSLNNLDSAWGKATNALDIKITRP